MAAALEASRLGVRRGDAWILRELSFELHGGEALGIVGASGAGKTTLAWALLGLLEPAEGEVRLQGRPWSSLSESERRPHRRAIQAVFQDPMTSLPPHRTGWEILTEPRAIHRIGPAASHREACAAMAAQVKFPEDCLDQRPGQWSVGLAQRLALARALMAGPKVLVLDEPLSALDPTLAGHLLQLLLGLKDEGLAIVFISHDPRAVLRLCDRRLDL